MEYLAIRNFRANGQHYQVGNVYNIDDKKIIQELLFLNCISKYVKKENKEIEFKEEVLQKKILKRVKK